MEDPTLPATWEIRRRVIFSTLLFCGFCVFYLMFFGEDSRINETIVAASYTLAGAVIGSYVFGVTWTDTKRIQLRQDGSTRSQQAERPPD